MEVGVQAVVRVGGHRGPAQQEHRQALSGLLQVGAPLDDLDIDVDADLLELGLQDGRNLGINLLVGDVQGLGEAVRISGFGEQRLGLLHVVLVRDEILVVAVDVLGQRAGKRLGAVGVGDLHDGFLVGGVVDRLTHAHVVKRRDAMVKGQVLDGEGVELLELEAGAGLEHRHELGTDVQRHVDAAGLQLGHHGRALRDDADDEVRGLRLLAEVLIVAGQPDLLVLLPGHELVRAGAHGVVGIVVAGLGDGLLIEDAHVHVGQVVQQGRAGRLGDELHGVVVDHVDLGQGAEHERGRRGGLRVDVALEGELDVGGLELLAVVELDALMELELHGVVVNLRPGLGQARLNGHFRAELDQRVVDLEHRQRGGRVVGAVRVQGHGVRRVADDQRVARGEGPGAAEHEHSGQDQESEYLFHVKYPPCVM